MYKIASIIAVFCSLTLSVNAFVVPSSPLGYVNDYANMLSGETKQQLEQELSIFTASTSNEIAVVTIPDLGGDTVEHYATKLFESWKIGNAKNDNGVLLLISRDEHKLRIEVGYGLEGTLPDLLAKNIIDNKITPSFKQGDYNSGVREGVKAIEEATRGEYKASTSQSSGKSFSFGNLLEIIFFFFAFGTQFLASILSRSKSWWAGGVLGGVLGGSLMFFQVFGASIVFGFIITTALILLGLLFDYIVSKGYNNAISSGSSIPWWAGGGVTYGGSSSSSSSFGGFSGGSSGGGGASGSW